MSMTYSTQLPVKLCQIVAKTWLILDLALGFDFLRSETPIQHLGILIDTVGEKFPAETGLAFSRIQVEYIK